MMGLLPSPKCPRTAPVTTDITDNPDGLSYNRGAVRAMQCYREGWQLIKDRFWFFLGVGLVGILVGSLAPFGILLGPMMCGVYLCLLRHMHGQPVTFDMLFKGFNYFANSLIATLIMVVPLILLF